MFTQSITPILRHLGAVVSLMLTLTLLSACGGSPPTTFYMLESNILSPVQELAESNTKKMPKVVLQEVVIPAYLDRTSIITRQANAVTVQISEFDSWSEDLADGIDRVLSDTLMPALLKENVMLLSIDDDDADARKIFIFVHRFEGALQGQVILDARWTVHSYDNRELVSGAFVESLPAGDTYASMVKAQSALLVQLGQSMTAPMAKALHKKR